LLYRKAYQGQGRASSVGQSIKDRVEHQVQDRASRREKASRTGYRAPGRGTNGVNRIGHQGEGRNELDIAHKR
jgi:hypothetical protein